MIPESYQILFVLATIVLMLAVLVTDKFKPSFVFVFTVAVLIFGGSLTLGDFIEGTINVSILTIFALIILAAGVNDNFDLAGFFDRLFGQSKSPRGFILKMGLSVSAVSSVMNNTPVVAMMMPYVYQWGKKHNVNPSKLLMPLSFSAIVGGVITLIGTSTNLVLNGLLIENGLEGLSFGDFFLPGILVTLACLGFMFLLGPVLLKDNKEILKNLEENAREYLVETVIPADSPLAGITVQGAGLRNLESVFLSEIIRGDVLVSPVRPNTVLIEGDRLLFAGDTDSVLKLLEEKEGLEIAKNRKYAMGDNSEIIEAIVTQNSQLDRHTAKEVGFRQRFDAAIIGIHRQGIKRGGKIGHQQLAAGDLLLLTAGPAFHDRISRMGDMIIINRFARTKTAPPAKRWMFILSLLAMISMVIGGILPLFPALLILLLVQFLLNFMDMEKIRNHFSFDLLLMLVAALALGRALVDSGAADWLTGALFHNIENWSPLTILIGVFAASFILTSMVTNVAAIAIVFPIIFGLSHVEDLPMEALFLTAAFGASCCFATPFAYQTNLMVMEAGDYGFKDFLRFGLPVSLVYATVFLTFAAFKFDLL